MGFSAKSIRFHCIDWVLTEIERYKAKFGGSHFVFFDDNFSANRNRAKELCRQIRDNRLAITFDCELVASEIDEEFAELLIEAGCRRVLIGAESGNEEVLRLTGKGITTKDIEQAVKLLSNKGIKSIDCSFIVGHPTDTIETVHETFRFAEHLKQLGATDVWLNPMTPFPGTEIYRSAKDLGLRILTCDWRQYVFFKIVMETEYLTKRMIADLMVEGLLLLKS